MELLEQSGSKPNDIDRRFTHERVPMPEEPDVIIKGQTVFAVGPRIASERVLCPCHPNEAHKQTLGFTERICRQRTRIVRVSLTEPCAA